MNKISGVARRILGWKLNTIGIVGMILKNGNSFQILISDLKKI